MGIIDALVPKLTDFVLLLIPFILGAFVGPYLKERGKSLATKKDIEPLTDAVERIRSDYKKEEHRYQLTSAGLLKKRTEVIEQLYKMIVDIEEAFQLVVDFAEWEDQPKDELRKKPVPCFTSLCENTRKAEFISAMVCVKSYRDSKS